MYKSSKILDMIVGNLMIHLASFHSFSWSNDTGIDSAALRIAAWSNLANLAIDLYKGKKQENSFRM